jgi:gamma-glutamylcyclotransferase (GGCT)/AIG2-like uncharacterized protein YtfP
MPIYFAYGANMDDEAMAARCPRTKLLGRARIMRRRLIITADGFASIIPDPRAVVRGVLYDLAQSDVAALDRFEEVGRGLYAKSSVLALREPLGSVRALVYIGRTSEQGPPAPGYLEALIAAARRQDLPQPYLAFLVSLSPQPRTPTDDRRAARRPRPFD